MTEQGRETVNRIVRPAEFSDGYTRAHLEFFLLGANPARLRRRPRYTHGRL